MSYGPENERDPIQREDDAQARHDQRERAGIHYWESADDEREAIVILEQIGYHRTDTKFMSLNLTDEQLNAISEAVKLGEGQPPEEVIAAGCRLLRSTVDSVIVNSAAASALCEPEWEGKCVALVPHPAVDSATATVPDKRSDCDREDEINELEMWGPAGRPRVSR